MKPRNNNTWKYPIKMFIIFLVLFCIIILQFGYISLFPSVYGINIKKFATNRNTVSTVLRASRGNILDSSGNALAINVTSYTVIAYLSSTRTTDSSNPKHVVDIDYTASKLSPILNMSEETLKKLLSSSAYQVELGPGGRGITEVKKKEIADLELPGIDFIEDQKRYYPNGDFASYIIGYAKEKFNSNFITSISMILGLAIVYTLGTIMFSFITGNTILQSLIYCVVPFIAVDILKLILAYIIGETVCKRVFSSLNIAK